MATNITYGDQHITGNLSCGSLTLPASAVSDAKVAADAGIASTKIEQQIEIHHRQPAAVITLTDYVHMARGAGTIVGVRAIADAVPAAANSYTIDVLLNGTSILSAPITIDNSTVADDIVDGTIVTTDYVADDLFKIVVTVTGGGSKGTGLNVTLLLRENPNP